MTLEQINIILFNAINQYAGSNSLLDWLAVFAAQYLPYGLILTVFYFWFSSKENYKNYFLFAAFSALLGISLNLVITLVYFHPRPFMIGLGHTLFNHSSGTSFPSDHATIMLSFAFMLLFFSSTRTLGGALVIAGLATGLARIFCGVHSPLDITGSIIVAAVSATVVWMLRNSLKIINRIIINFYNGLVKGT